MVTLCLPSFGPLDKARALEADSLRKMTSYLRSPELHSSEQHLTHANTQGLSPSLSQVRQSIELGLRPAAPGIQRANPLRLHLRDCPRVFQGLSPSFSQVNPPQLTRTYPGTVPEFLLE